ncbi:hypothetical protein GOP47_0015104 [Adiantum capillus-veneris]|uniref:U3 small nucleolar RNA-associated protein 11 n=1 Tax=Adiantum capillus-veneris TaxID=13818 RepID=A0A9D4UMR2_ADICA|nr:hypothetical protein GOP47_0014599 [Adiantum capillus-veneris]KAI5070761.1 hypothetical protein GOP47_0015104 [Adiantum capillus-veneris]
MSSLRNAVRRREHKERSQPSDRQKYGLLEKHKDYVLRAQDFHRKEDAIKKLKEKAATRNPDEFYFKMINTKTVGGVHRQQTAAKQYTHEELLLMKTQDIAYVLSKAQSEQKKVERLQAALHSLDQPPINKHTYFAEDGKAAKEMMPLLMSDQSQGQAVGNKLPKRIKKLRDGAYRELEERKERAAKLRSMVLTMSMQKEVMGKGRKRKLNGDEVSPTTEAPVFKWHKERKR